MQHVFQPLRPESRFYSDAGGSRPCGIKPLGLTRDMLQAALDQLARRGIHHCDLLKPRVKSHPIISIVVRLLSSEPWSINRYQVYSLEGSRRRYPIRSPYRDMAISARGLLSRRDERI